MSVPQEAHFLQLRKSFGFSDSIKAQFDEPAAVIKVKTTFFVPQPGVKFVPVLIIG